MANDKKKRGDAEQVTEREPGFPPPEPQPEEPEPGMTPKGHRMGHVPGGFPDDTPSTKQLFGARPLAMPYSAMELLPFVDYIRDQKQTSSCVGQALARIIHIRAQMQLFLLGLLTNALFPAALALYALARQMVLGGDHSLPDDGSYPGKALLAASRYGLVPEERYPFNERVVTQAVPLDVLEGGQAALFQGFYRIDSEGSALVEDCKQALAKGYPFMMALQVDDVFDQCNSDTPLGPPTGKIHGGHMVAIIGYSGNNFLMVNSWGTTWGFNGFAWLTAEAIAAGTDHSVAQVAPVMEAA
jgi:hypothetical protein